jgi:translation initiation factor 2B subunit (eIF-2B alpha/beta/delta family)
LSTCANLKIDVNIAKILVGKSVDKSMLTYLSEVEHKNAFREVKQVLTLTNGRIDDTMQAKDLEIARLRKRIETLEQIQKGMLEIYGEELMKKAMERLQIRKDTGKPATLIEALQLLGKMKEREQAKEYAKIIEENNNNKN